MDSKKEEGLVKRFLNRFKPKVCPNCNNQPLRRSTISTKDKNGKLKPLLICPICGHKE